MDDHPNEHEAESEAGGHRRTLVAPEAIAPTAAVEPTGPEPAVRMVRRRPAIRSDWLTVRPAPITAPDPWVVFAHDQEVRAKAVSKRRTKRMLIASGAAVVIIAAAVGGVIAGRGAGACRGSGMAPADFVVSSTQTTLAQRTADVAYSGSISADGQDVPLQRQRTGRLRHEHLQCLPDGGRFVNHDRPPRTDRIGPVLHGHDDRRTGHVRRSRVGRTGPAFRCPTRRVRAASVRPTWTRSVS